MKQNCYEAMYYLVNTNGFHTTVCPCLEISKVNSTALWQGFEPQLIVIPNMIS